jgi:hypothetical protein
MFVVKNVQDLNIYLIFFFLDPKLDIICSTIGAEAWVQKLK